MMNKFFENITVLTTNRTESCKQHLEDYNIKARYFHSIYNDDPKVSCNMSIMQIMKQFAESDDKTLLYMEDDCGYRNMQLLNTMMKNINHWDILYFGYNIAFDGCEKPLKHNEYWVRLINAWSIHCVAFKKDIVLDIIERYNYQDMFDTWLGKNLFRYKAYGCTPMLAWQLPNYSDLWKEEVNYSNLFIQSENIAKSI